AADFSMASQTKKPDAMLMSSIKPRKSFDICLSHNLDVFLGHRAYLAVDTGVHVRAEFALLDTTHNLPLPYFLAFLHRRHRRLSRVLLQLDPHRGRLAPGGRVISRLSFLLFHLQPLA